MPSKIIYTSGITGFIGKNSLPMLLNYYDKVVNFTSKESLKIYTKSKSYETDITTDFFKKNTSNEFLNLATLHLPNPSSAIEMRNLFQANIYFPMKVLGHLDCFENLKIINELYYQYDRELKIMKIDLLIKKENSTLSKNQSEIHTHPVLHTNKQIWYSSIKQPFLESKKVMWSRSGYTIPFYDPGTLGGTDLVYYVIVDTDEEGTNLTNNLNTKLFKYIFKTAKWSGFGNDKVYYLLPKLPNVKYTNKSINKYFNLTNEEIDYMNSLVK